MKYIFLFILACSYCHIGVCQINPILLVEWETAEAYSIQHGQITCKSAMQSKVELEIAEYASNSIALEAYFQQFISLYKSMPSDKQDVLFYIHGFGAHRTKYVKINSGTIYEQILSRQGSDIGLLSSLIWEGGSKYIPTIPKAVDIGYYYGGVIAECVRRVRAINPKAQVHLLTHSMGNRVYIGVFNRLREEFDGPVFAQHIMAAPDIEPTVFDAGQPLEYINSISQNVTIYRHYLDRVLASSSGFSGKERLGFTGLTAGHLDSIRADITLVDCSYLNDNEKVDFGNHNYYYLSPTVRNDIFNILTENQAEFLQTRTTFKHPSRFILQFEEED